MSDVDGSFSKRTLQFYKITTHLVLTCMIISTICGIIIVTDSGNSRYELSYAFKNNLKIPAWTSLPLIVSVILGYLSVFLKNRKILIGKLIADIINILARLLFIILFSLFLITGLHACIRKQTLPDHVTRTDDFHFRFAVDCTVDTISDVRLEFGLYIMIMLMESIALITLIASCVFYCVQCRLNCKSCLSDHHQVLYHNQEEAIHVNIEEKERF